MNPTRFSTHSSSSRFSSGLVIRAQRFFARALQTSATVLAGIAIGLLPYSTSIAGVTTAKVPKQLTTEAGDLARTTPWMFHGQFGVTEDESFEGGGAILAPLYNTHNTLVYLYPRFGALDAGRQNYSIGLGARHLLPNDYGVIGANIFYDHADYRGLPGFSQVGGGLEYLGNWVDGRFNAYLSTSDAKRIDRQRVRNTSTTTSTRSQSTFSDLYATDNRIAQDSVFQRRTTTTTITEHHTFDRFIAGMDGLDLEIGVRAPEFWQPLQLRLYAGLYHYDNPYGSNLSGFKSRAEARLWERLYLDLAYYEDDALVGGNFQVGVRVSIPLERRGWQAPPPAANTREQLHRRMVEPVVRHHRVQLADSGYIENTDLFKREVDRQTKTSSRRQTHTILDDVFFANNGDATNNGIQESPGSDGTAQRPFNNIQDAVDAAATFWLNSGNTGNVYVQGGGSIYTEDVDISGSMNILSSATIITGLGGKTFGTGDRPTLDGGFATPALNLTGQSLELSITGFEIINGYAGSNVFAFGNGIFVSQYDEVIIDDNIFDTNFAGVEIANPADASAYITNNTFQGSPILDSLRLIALGSDSHFHVADNLFLDNPNRSSVFASSTLDANLSLNLENNTFLGTGQHAVLGNAFGGEIFTMANNNTSIGDFTFESIAGDTILLAFDNIFSGSGINMETLLGSESILIAENNSFTNGGITGNVSGLSEGVFISSDNTFTDGGIDFTSSGGSTAITVIQDNMFNDSDINLTVAGTILTSELVAIISDNELSNSSINLNQSGRTDLEAIISENEINMGGINYARTGSTGFLNAPRPATTTLLITENEINDGTGIQLDFENRNTAEAIIADNTITNNTSDSAIGILVGTRSILSASITGNQIHNASQDGLTLGIAGISNPANASTVNWFVGDNHFNTMGDGILFTLGQNSTLNSNIASNTFATNPSPAGTAINGTVGQGANFTGNINNNEISGPWNGGIAMLLTDNATWDGSITNNTVENIAGQGIAATILNNSTWDGGINNNTSSDNAGTGISATIIGSAWNGGINNNIASDNTGSGISATAIDSTWDGRIYNNTASFNDGGGINATAIDSTWDGSINDNDVNFNSGYGINATAINSTWERGIINNTASFNSAGGINATIIDSTWNAGINNNSSSFNSGYGINATVINSTWDGGINNNTARFNSAGGINATVINSTWERGINNNIASLNLGSGINATVIDSTWNGGINSNTSSLNSGYGINATVINSTWDGGINNNTARFNSDGGINATVIDSTWERGINNNTANLNLDNGITAFVVGSIWDGNINNNTARFNFSDGLNLTRIGGNWTGGINGNNFTNNFGSDISIIDIP